MNKSCQPTVIRTGLQSPSLPCCSRYCFVFSISHFLSLLLSLSLSFMFSSLPVCFQHEQPGSDNKLTKKQYALMQNLRNTLDSLSERMCNRLVESLRRKNEALKQAGKRERSDPLSLMAPLVSPCCLGDDTIPLHLLVKLGKTQEAATAYAARRSLLLLERYVHSAVTHTLSIDR